MFSHREDNVSVLRSEGDGQECQIKNVDLQSKNKNQVQDCKVFRLPKSYVSSKYGDLPSVKEIAVKLNKITTFNVPDNEVLCKPLPDFSNKILIQNIKVVSCQRKQHSDATKCKEPKFIPYEPYKACVNGIFEISTNDKKTKTCNARLRNCENEKVCPEITDLENQKCQWEATNSDLYGENRNLNNELSKLKKEVSLLQHQLSVQSQVNTELKKLLVASVGEDVQGRVQCLSEDKARMASMIRKYSEKVDHDFEEKEKISIECDVWRSKFYASSLLLDELARWKGTLLQKYKEAETALSVLLQEGEITHRSLQKSYRNLREIQEAFDPFRSDPSAAHAFIAEDSLSLAVGLDQLSEALRNRLLGDLGRPVAADNRDSTAVFPTESRTPGERMALQVLESKLDPGSFSLSPTSSSRALLDRLHPTVRTEKLTFNCCQNCDGEIFVV